MNSTSRSRVTGLAKAIATAGGVGYSPQSPGTAGTVVAVPLALALATAPLWLYAAVTAALFAAGTWAAIVADADWGTHDSGRIVIDEVVGYLLTVGLFNCSDWAVLALGFALFRLFDIAKPPPIRWVDQQVGGGLGVMLDDVVAGVFAAAALWVLIHFEAATRLHTLFG